MHTTIFTLVNYSASFSIVPGNGPNNGINFGRARQWTTNNEINFGRARQWVTNNGINLDRARQWAQSMGLIWVAPGSGPKQWD